MRKKTVCTKDLLNSNATAAKTVELESNREKYVRRRVYLEKRGVYGYIFHVEPYWLEGSKGNFAFSTFVPFLHS